MKDELIKFPTAKLAKEKGFDWKTDFAYDGVGSLFKFMPHHNFASRAPTQSLLQRWLREVHGIHVKASFIKDQEEKLWYMGQWFDDMVHKGTTQPKDTYEQALEEGLIEGLNLIR